MFNTHFTRSLSRIASRFLNLEKISSLLGLRRHVYFHTPDHYIDTHPILNFSLSQKGQKEGPLLNIFFLRPSQTKQTGECWSNWGQGLLASNKKYYFAVGNHLEESGRGDTYLYEYSPEARSLATKFHLRQITRDPAVACGKIHGHICEGRDHNIYFASYWGQELMDEIKSGRFLGTALYKLNPAADKAEYLGLLSRGAVARAAKLYLPSMWFYTLTLPEHRLIIYDLDSNRLAYTSREKFKFEEHDLCIDDQGNALLVLIGGQLAVFKKEERRIEVTPFNLKKSLKPWKPVKHSLLRSPFMRTSNFLFPDSSMLGLTNEGRLFSYTLKDRILRDYGDIFPKPAYTASAALSQNQRYLYFIPGSLKEASLLGVPLVRFDIKSQSRKTLMQLGNVFREAFHYKIGGAFSTSIHPNQKELFLVCNGCSLKGLHMHNCPPYGQPVFIHMIFGESELGE